MVIFLRVKLLQELQERTRAAHQPMGDPILVALEVRKGETGRTELGISDPMGQQQVGRCGRSDSAAWNLKQWTKLKTQFPSR